MMPWNGIEVPFCDERLGRCDEPLPLVWIRSVQRESRLYIVRIARGKNYHLVQICSKNTIIISSHIHGDCDVLGPV